MVDHAWVLENLDAYLAGDLTKVERDNIELHLAACESCPQALAEVRRLEQMMNGLFADARPTANLDERIIQNLGKAPARRLRRPTLWRFVGAAAAVLVVGLIGAAVQAISSEGGSPLAIVKEAWEKNANTTFTTVGAKIGVNDSAALPSSREKKIDGLMSVNKIQDGDGYTSSLKLLLEPATQDHALPSIPEDAKDITYSVEVTSKASVPGKADKSEAVGIRDGDKSVLSTGIPPPPPGFEFGGEKGKGGGGGGARELPKMKEKLAIPYDPKDSFFRLNKKLEEAGYDDRNSKNLDKMQKDLVTSFDQRKETKEPLIERTTTDPNTEKPVANHGLPKLFVPMPVPTLSPPVAPTYIDISPSPVSPPGPFPPGDDKGESKKGSGKSKGPPKGNEKGEEEKAPDVNKPAEPKKLPPDEPPLETNRKIIRTGDMEFEVDSFYKASEAVASLIIGETKDGKVIRPGIKGGFIATRNSEKLPNGKMRGSIVVRMPPQYLDEFVRDLRRELTKTGELKNERIVSLDVTKQYTDIESRVRAARTMEEWLIQIIKVGKGEIKDLLAAERELGTWRTKIEEMEGEIRYYSNQVSLSTLTITLNEKEISAPTSIVFTESVRLRLEVDNVSEAHQKAMDAVAAVDGTVTKAELKRHPGGQLQSILEAEIPPKKKIEFSTKLEALGFVSDKQENQFQHTEGGTGKAVKLEPRKGDVHFDITMYSTANIRPRLAVDLKIATIDVPASYTKILDAVTKAKGQVHSANLNEQDKANINATITFNVPIAAKPTIDMVLLDVGQMLERVNVRAPFSELSTERTFGYSIVLRDFVSIPPSKAVIEVIAAVNVELAFEKLQAAIKQAKGHIADTRFDELDKLNINAKIEFSVFIEEKKTIDDLLKDLGISLSRTNAQPPLNQLSTARKFGYVVILRDFANIPPLKSIEVTAAVTDVRATFAELVTAVKAAGGKLDAKLNEKDKLNISAHLAFNVPDEKKAGIDELLKKLEKLDTVLSRNETQLPANQLATDKKFGYVVDLRDFATIDPSQLAKMTIAAADVRSNFAKLVDEVKKAKGRVIKANLNEKDKLNITGQIDFTIPKEEKAKFEKLLEEMGTILSRSDEQAPMGVLATDHKLGYGVEIRDFANIRPRETFILQIAMNDVPTAFHELQAAVVRAKGWVSVGNLVEDNKAKIEAQFDFDVPAAEKAMIEGLLVKAGAITSRTSSQVPVDQLATDKKVGYRLKLVSSASIPPREVVALKFDVTDVDAKAAALKDIVIAAGGRVIDSSIERLENGKSTAVLVLEVPFASQEEAIRKMKDAAKLVFQKASRPKMQLPENKLSTVHLLVELTGSTPIVPTDEGISSSVNKSLYLSFRILMGIFMALIVGLSAIVPCVLLIWIGFKAYTILGSSSSSGPILAPAGGSKLMAEEEKPGDSDGTAKP